ncbi:MAG: hypothetical protein ACFCUQ_01165 [Kiloniellales bacterium]
MKILLSGYLCNPYRGSEAGRTWNWAWHLAKQHQVWVLTQPIARPKIEEFLAEHPNDNLRFLWVEAVLPGQVFARIISLVNSWRGLPLELTSA